MAASASADELEVLTRLRQRLLGRGAPGSSIGRYRLIRALGQGGMGEVWLADDPRLARRVALKLLHGRDGSGSQARLVREAQAIAQITHPNVVAVFDCGTVAVTPGGPSRAFIAMEYVAGASLDAWLVAAPRDAEAILAVFVQAGRGLAAAHAAGQIHRDFKPANVMVGADGCAKVLDFGLVLHESESSASASGITELLAAAPSEDDPPPTEPAASRLTEPGLVMGTPRYMAPEQHTGAPVTAASDQFAFCCALLESLQGESPYGDRSYAELGRAKLEGRVHRVETPRVSARLRAVLERGLAADPAARWPTMTALLDELTPRRAAGWGRAPVWALSAGVLGVVVAARPEPDACAASRGPAPPAVVLDDDAALAARIDAALADYHARLQAHEVAACEAHRDGQLADAAFDHRAACLRARRGDLRAAIDVLADGDVAILGRADAIVAGLPELDACLDDARSGDASTRPAGVEAARAVASAREKVSRARAVLFAGEHREALAILDEARAALDGVDHPPTSAEIDLEVGRIGTELGDAGAIDALERSLLLAEASRHDRVAAEAIAALIHALTQRPELHARALALVPRGDALVRRAGDPAVLRGRYWMAVGGLHLQRIDLPASLAAYERSYAALASASSPDDPDLGVARVNLGSVLRNLGRYDEAIDHHAAVLAMRERTMGSRHPRTIRALINLGLDHESAGDATEAARLLQDAVERAEAGLGPNHADLAFALGAVARVSRSLRRFDESRVAYVRALAIAERRGESSTAETALLLSNLGNLERQTFRLDDARVHLEQAIALRERIFGPGHYVVGQSRHTLAGVELLAGDFARARSLALEAVAIHRAAHQASRGADLEDVSNAEVRAAEALLGSGRVAEARAHIDAALVAWPEHDDYSARILGRVELAEGDTASAIDHLTQAIDLADEPWDRGLARTYLAVAQRAAGEPAAAELARAEAHAELESAGVAGLAGLRTWSELAPSRVVGGPG